MDHCDDAHDTAPAVGTARRILGLTPPAAAAAAFGVWIVLLVATPPVESQGHDFGRLYHSAASFRRGENMYGWNAATPAQLDSTHVVDLWNMNPPHFHLLLLPLTRMPWRPALVLWLAAGFALLALTLGLTLRALSVRPAPGMAKLGVVAALAFSGTTTVCQTAQLTLVLLPVVTLIWLEARRGHWVRSGVYLGLCMSVKPFLLFLVPYYLLSRRWAAAAAAFGTAALAFALGACVFGVENTQAWCRGLGKVDWEWLPLNASLLGMLSRTFGPSLFFRPVVVLPAGGVKAVWMAAGGAIGIAALLTAPRDGSERSVDRAFALLLATSLLLCPLGWAYYFWLPMGPIIALAAAEYRAVASARDPTARLCEALGRIVPWWSLPGLLFPTLVTVACQPSALATLVLGDVYFWTLIGVWGRLWVLAAQAARTAAPEGHGAQSAVLVCRQSFAAIRPGDGGARPPGHLCAVGAARKPSDGPRA